MISIIGAGPAGSHAAYLLAKRGYDVQVFEAKKNIGLPIQCTGIVTSTLSSIVNIEKEFLVNTVNRARIHSPDGNCIDVKLGKPNLVIDREKFDKHLAKKAEKAGAKIHLGCKFEGLRNGKMVINGKDVPTDYLIGADGPNSAVSRYICSKTRRNVLGVQARVKGKFDKDTVEFWPGTGEFAWLVPESSTIARVGLAGKQNVRAQFEELLKRVGGKVIEKQGGLIPIYSPKQPIQRGKIMTLGDAAGQVKATTYGGLVPGLIAAEELAKSLKNYERNYKKRMKKELYLGLAIRKALNNFKKEDYNQLVKYFSQDKIKRILEEEDRDFPSRFLFKTLLMEPRMIKFATKLVF